MLAARSGGGFAGGVRDVFSSATDTATGTATTALVGTNVLPSDIFAATVSCTSSSSGR